MNNLKECIEVLEELKGLISTKNFRPQSELELSDLEIESCRAIVFALSVLGKLIKTKEILRNARKNNVTLQGEMFIDYLATALLEELTKE